MIDEMIRCKNLESCDKIETIHEWFYKCPPQGKLKHWKDGRSAKETAKHWLHTIPQPFKDLLKSRQLKYVLCSPEFVSQLDSYKGNGRNHDLLILAQTEIKENVVISLESKVDESFGDTISDSIKNATTAFEKNPNSKALDRIKELRESLFGEENDNQLQLRYQLVTAVAGTVAEAKMQKAKLAVFIVQTFISDKIDKTKHSNNQKDLDKFMSVFTKIQVTRIEENQVLGPFRIGKSNEFISDAIDLWIGKYEIEI